MLGNDGTYAGKKRKKPMQKSKTRPENAKTNPSKRHRDRLNGELDTLTSLLPFSEEVRSRLDKLSVLRLSVAYIKVKNFFNATMKNSSAPFPLGGVSGMNAGMALSNTSEGDLLLQALHGFVLVVTSEGYVFYVSPSIEDHLGFHQSDVLHQSVFELIHTEDRAMFRRQLHFALNPQSLSQEQGGEDMQSSSDITQNVMTYDPKCIPPENSSFLERTFVCRMRCLLDNSSGFLALNFQGRLKYLHGQGVSVNGTSVQPQLGLFAVARPVQPPSILEIRSKTLIFQSKHKLDFTPMGIDSRGRVALGYTELELCMRGSGYQFIHAADMMYCADNHVRMMKKGESGLTVFRLLTKEAGWVWVQANARLIYKDGRPDFIIARQRILLNEEGEEHLRQRKLQLPFTYTSGEAVLYEHSPSFDLAEISGNGPGATARKTFDGKELDPNSLLGSFYKQNPSSYMQSDTESQLSMDKIFMGSRALVNVPSNAWQGETTPSKDSMLVAMLETFEQMAENGDLGDGMPGMDTDTSELRDWENALLRLGNTKDSVSDCLLSLDDILTEDILSHLEETLLKECPQSLLPHPQTDMELSKLLPGLNGNFNGSSVNGIKTMAVHQEAVKQELGPVDQTMPFELPIEDSIPPLQDLQLDDESSAFILELDNLPGLRQNGSTSYRQFDKLTQKGLGSGLNSPTPAFTGDGFGRPIRWMIGSQKEQPSSSGKRHMISGNRCPPSQCHSQASESIVAAGKMNCHQSSHISLERQHNSVSEERDPSVLAVAGMNVPIHQVNNESTVTQNVHHNGHILNHPSVPFQNSVCKWPDNTVPKAGLNSFLPDCQIQVPAQDEQWTPCLSNTNMQSHLNFVNGKYHSKPPGVLVDEEGPSPSSCMFRLQPVVPENGPNQRLPGGQAATLFTPGNTGSHDQSPSQASCYFQWGTGKPVVGTSSIPQDSVCISPPSCPLTSGQTTSNVILQQYLKCSGQTQIQCHWSGQEESAPVNGSMHFPENVPTHCYKF